jgi:hypothetical protein
VAKRKKRRESGILEEFFNRATLAEYLDVAESTITGWQARGEGPPSFMLGGQRLYSKEDVREWINQKRQAEKTAALKPKKRGRPRKRLRGRK